MAKPETVKKATGRTQEQWYSLLDKWGAPGHPFKEVSEFLTGKHGLSRWWAQKLIVEYEQDRGVRKPGVRPDGTYEVSASKTVTVPAIQIFDAIVDPRRRSRWLTDGSLRLREADKPHSARFAWDGGPSRVTITVTPKDRSKASVSVAHDRLSDARRAESMKAFWRERLTDLKATLERP